MGTNYYWYEKPPCCECGREFDRLHIGKASAGWCFSLHVIPERGINELADWRRLWEIPGSGPIQVDVLVDDWQWRSFDVHIEYDPRFRAVRSAND